VSNLKKLFPLQDHVLYRTPQDALNFGMSHSTEHRENLLVVWLKLSPYASQLDL